MHTPQTIYLHKTPDLEGAGCFIYGMNRCRPVRPMKYIGVDFCGSTFLGLLFQPWASNCACPWNEASQLLVLGITTKEFDDGDVEGCNYVFLIDTSGSMASPTATLVEMLT